MNCTLAFSLAEESRAGLWATVGHSLWLASASELISRNKNYLPLEGDSGYLEASAR